MHPSKAYISIEEQEDKSPTLVRDEQYWNALSPIFVQEDKSPIQARDVHSEKAEAPTDVHEDKSTLVRDVQPKKAEEPMISTVFGIIVDAHPVIIVVTLEESSVAIIALQLLRESYMGLPSSTTIEVKPEQLEKGFSPISVKFFGIVMEVNLEQPEKAEGPNEVQEDRSPTLVRAEQLSKAELPIEVQEDKSPTLARAEQREKA